MKFVDKKLISELKENATNAPRGRVMHVFHDFAEDPLQRMLNVMRKGSYVQPHRHLNPDKREMFIIIEGRAAYFEFDNEGSITETYILDPESGNFAVEISEKCYHTITALSETALVFEIKDGPYSPALDKDFAPWAPPEGSSESTEYLKKILEETRVGNLEI